MFRKRDLQNKVEIPEKLKLGEKKGGRETGWEESAVERHRGRPGYSRGVNLRVLPGTGETW